MFDDERGSGVAWLALVVAGVSLWLSWTVYDKINEVTLEETIRTEVDSVMERIRSEESEQATTTATTTSATTTATTTQE